MRGLKNGSAARSIAALTVWGVLAAGAVFGTALAAGDAPIPPPALTAAPALAPPHEAVVLNPNCDWDSTSWAGQEDTNCAWAIPREHSRAFFVGDGNHRNIWLYRFATAIEPAQFPRLSLTYRAEHIAADKYYVLWLDDTTGPDRGGLSPVRGRDLVPDGQPHTLTVDIRKLAPAGHFTTLALCVSNDGAGVAELELLDLRLERTEDSVAVADAGEDRPVTVRVSDEQSNPLEDATVTVDLERLNCLRTARTRADGVAVTGYVPLREMRHIVRAEKAGWIPAEADLRGNAAALVLRRAVTLKGRVVNEEGAPVAQAVVAATFDAADPLRGTYGRQALPKLSVVTDAQGHWELQPVDAAVKAVRLDVTHMDYVWLSWYDPESRFDVNELRRGTAVTVLKKGAAISGMVRHAAGGPVVRAAVVSGEDTRGRYTVPAMTDKNGRFRCRPAALGRQVVTISAKGCAPEIVQVDAQPDTPPLDIVLGAPNTVRFRVVSAKGDPVAGAFVSAAAWRGFRTLKVNLYTGADGRAAWADAPADAVRYNIIGPSATRVEYLALLPDEAEHVIKLPVPISISVTVSDAETSKPVDGFRVAIRQVGTEGGRSKWARIALPQGFRPNIPWTVYWSPDVAGVRVDAVRVDAEGYLPAVSETKKPVDGVQAVEFKLKRAPNLTGNVRAPDGRPVAGAHAAVYIEGDSVNLLNGKPKDAQVDPAPQAACVTDAQGRYNLPPQQGDFLLMVTAPEGSAFVAGRDLARDADVDLRPWARVEGLLRDNGPAPAPRPMLLRMEPLCAEGSSVRIAMELTTRTDGAGRFVFDQAPEGVAWVSDLGQLDEYTPGGTERQRVRLQAGQRRAVELGVGGRPLTGRMVLPAGVLDGFFWSCGHGVLTPKGPDTGALLDRREFAFAIRRDGAFRADAVPPGVYELLVQVCEPGAAGIPGAREVIGRCQRTVLVLEEASAAAAGAPMDLGTVEMVARRRLLLDDEAPPFDVPSSAARNLTLADLRGKLALVAFLDTRLPECEKAVADIRAVWEAFGADPRFRLVLLCADADAAAVQNFLTNHRLPAPYGLLGAQERSRAMMDYGVTSLPAFFLIQADGKIAGKGLLSDELMLPVSHLIRQAPADQRPATRAP